MSNQGPTITVRPYDSARGDVADVEGGDVSVSFDGSGVLIAGNSAGLGDLARCWSIAAGRHRSPVTGPFRSAA